MDACAKQCFRERKLSVLLLILCLQKMRLETSRGLRLNRRMDTKVAVLEPSLGRRWFGAIILGLIGVILIYWSISYPPETLIARILMPILGVLCFWQVQWNMRVSQYGLYLTKEGLFDANDVLICPLYNMAEVDRGLFAFRPSNGFLVRLHEPEEKGWAPGLYWRLGKRLGVGGATHPAQNKAMAQAIEALILERSLGPELN